ncbi:hypothetical protein L4C34_03510 [Vibrio profundum]|uniref:hypothetical protein n=1 Tax=Vibrio profundum TaxID=2910247 RepID=UPI003D0F66B2
MMVQRNIHGEWNIRFEDRILYSKVVGATNDEARKAWFEELKSSIQSSQEGFSCPWVILHDLRNWDTATLDTWEGANMFVDWASEHNCLLLAIVFSKKIQHFAMSKGLNNQKVLQFFFNYDEAHQACLSKLS